MGIGKWIGATVVSVIALVVVLIFIGLIPLPSFQGLPKCTFGKVYYEQDFVDQYYYLYDSQSIESCICSESSEWIPEVSGYYCVPIDNMRPDCIPGKPEDNLLNCNCISPNIWIEDESGGFVCDEW